METTTSLLPLSETLTPSTPADVAEAVRAAYDASVPVYPIGGSTAIGYGLAPTRQGHGLQLCGLDRVIDYTPRDMTIVVEAGLRMAELASTLAAERQHLPIDAPQANEATIGGLVATNWSGPRRFGYGTLRDYLIGVHAVDGRGTPFKGGGRVVKNVAGYDFCKLLIGSLGTIGVVTQLTFKVKPLAERAVTVVAECADLDVADRILDALVQTPAPPTAIDLLAGTAWNAALEGSADSSLSLVVRFEGSESEAAFLRDDLAGRLSAARGNNVRELDPVAADELLARQVEFPDRGVDQTGDESPLVIKVTAVPSAVPQLVGLVREIDREAAIQAHAGSGIIIARFANFDAADLSTVLVGRLRPAAIRHEGSLTVLASQFEGLTQQIVWGGRVEWSGLMERIKAQFDPRGILNPGRFLF